MLADAAKGLEARDHAGVNGGGGFAVELLIDDGFGEGFEGGLAGGEAQGEGAGAGDELGKLRVSGGERGDGLGGVVGELAGGAGAGHMGMIGGTAAAEKSSSGLDHEGAISKDGGRS